jgi:hypothetical protein
MRRRFKIVSAFAVAGAVALACPAKAGFNIDDQGPGVGNDNNAAATWSADVAGSGPSTWQGISGWQGGGYDQGGYGPRPRPGPWGPPGGGTGERNRGGPDFGDGRGAADWGGAPHYVNPANGVDWETRGWRGGDGGGGHWHGGEGAHGGGFGPGGPGGPGGRGGPGGHGRGR